MSRFVEALRFGVPASGGKPAKAGTPNLRFMESPLSLRCMHWDHEPRRKVKPAEAGTPNPRFLEKTKAWPPEGGTPNRGVLNELTHPTFH